MSIWNLSSGKSAQEIAESGATKFETNNNFLPLPDKSYHNATVSAIAWDEYGDVEHIQVTWDIVGEDSPFKNRKVFHKIKVNADKDTARDNAIKMLIALNAIGGADLLSIANPTNDDLEEALLGVCACIKVDLWAMKDSGAYGNYVSGVDETADDLDEQDYEALMANTLERLAKLGIDVGEPKEKGGKKTSGKPDQKAAKSGEGRKSRF